MTRSLKQHNRRVDARSKPFARAIERWLRSYALDVLNEELSNRKLKAKADLNDLDAILERYGVRLAKETAKKGAGPEYSELVVANWAQRDYFRGKTTRVTGIARETRKMVRLAIQRIMQDARRETPTPSKGEIARRIRAAYRKGELPGFKAAISPERAALIARTESTQAENSGIFAGYRATGVDEIEWMAYSDGRSGDRKHDQMDGKRIKIGEKFYNPATGVRLRYPGDPSAPISETANCRCTIAPVRSVK